MKLGAHAFAWSFFSVASVLTMVGCATQPESQYAGDPVEGRQVAIDLCSDCHSVEPIGSSPNPGAPPLRDVLSKYDPDQLQRDFENAVTVSHMRMPTFYFGEHHPADVVAYLKTIQRKREPQSRF